ncbi:MAG: hypothetical protein U0L09_10240, partial [Christensenellales bacterium]|nr:hypothetical protein [Christensenellales bacterium]
WIMSGKSVSGLIESFSEESDRRVAVGALSYEPLPRERDDILRMAESCLRTIRKHRLMVRSAEILEEIKTADSERRRELYQRLDTINRELDG